MTSITQADPAVNRSSVRPGLTALQAANQRLLARREAQAAKRSALATLPIARSVCLPDHLVWGCQRLSTVIYSAPPQNTPPAKALVVAPISAESATTTPGATVRVQPSILLAMLRQQKEAAGRVWLLARHLDPQGRGWLTIAALRQHLTNKQSANRICGWRRLRQIITAGQGVFWQTDAQGRLWLRSTARVAATLHVERLAGTAVRLPVATLLDNIRIVRAHFFASFHSGRHTANPISRQALAQLSGVAERTQRNYDRLTQTRAAANVAVGAALSAENRQTTSYRRRHGCFVLTDRQGKQGAAGRQYHAWRLPNSYHGVHERDRRGHHRKLNRWLKQHVDLVTNRAQGNDVPPQRLFFDGASVRSIRPNSQHDAYWYDNTTQLWQVITPCV